MTEERTLGEDRPDENLADDPERTTASDEPAKFEEGDLVDRIRIFKFRVATTLIALFMFASFLLGSGLKDEHFYVYLLGNTLAVGFGIIAGIGLSEYVSQMLLSSITIRRWINKPYFIEGYWKLTTKRNDYDEQDPENPSIDLTRNGIMLIDYNHSADKYSVIVTRLDKHGEIFVTASEYCYMTEGNHSVKYLNYFTIRDANPTAMCTCDGFFVKRYRRTGSVDFFSARVAVDGAHARDQYAVPIDEEEINDFRKVEKDWQRAFLTDWNLKTRMPAAA